MKEVPKPAKVHRRHVVTTLLWCVRICVFGFVLVILLYGASETARSALRFSPLLFLSRTLEKDVLSFSSNADLFAAIVAFLILLACFVRKRFFCRYVCPVGLCVDAIAILRRKIFRRRFLRNGLTFPRRRFFIFFSLFWVCSTTPLFFYPKLASSITAFAFDPMALLSQTLNSFPKITPVGVMFAICFVISPYFWRYQFCPCGAFQELLYFPKSFIIKQLNKFRHKRLVEEDCPHETNARRDFFTRFGLYCLAIAVVATIKKQSLRLKKYFFRPPGAPQENDFLARCARCGRCVKACPNGILTLANFSKPADTDAVDNAIERNDGADLSALSKTILANTPVVDFSLGAHFCEKECDACAVACPTGAISISDLEDKSRRPIGVVKFEMEHCMLYYDQECSICRRECPYGAIDLIWLEEEYLEAPSIDENLCVGCGQCVVSCPGEPIVLNFGEYAEVDDKKRIKALSIVQKQHD